MLVAESEQGSRLVRPRFQDHRFALPDYANSSSAEVDSVVAAAVRAAVRRSVSTEHPPN
jgi:hypothetical protein